MVEQTAIIDFSKQLRLGHYLNLSHLTYSIFFPFNLNLSNIYTLTNMVYHVEV